jgi:hypothetical protein
MSGIGSRPTGHVLASVMATLLRSPARWWGFVLTIILGAMACLVWGFAIATVLAIFMEVTPGQNLDFFTTWRHIATLWPQVGIEELVFRAPLALPLAFGLRQLVLPMTITLSILFGLAHRVDLPHLAIQGGEGVILSVVFLRCGGLHRGPFRGWACATAAHGLMDSAIGLLLYFHLKGDV